MAGGKGIIDRFYSLASPCNLCPHECKVNRQKGERGKCKTGFNPMISSATLHLGEEKELVGKRGSGTIFFTGCNLECKFCQNYDVSQDMKGKEISVEELASIMLNLQMKGAENINLVTPTHQSHVIAHALFIAKKEGLNIPIVYNCGGYESIKTLALLEGLIDIYMPDTKYSDNHYAEEFSGVKNYFQVLKKAIKEMYRQVGDLRVNSKGIARKGLLIRHLVMPGGLYGLSGSKKILDFIAYDISKDTYINIMGQYHPASSSYNYPDTIGRKLLRSHYHEVRDYAQSIGLHRGLS